jgi:hypothetical protein
MMQYFKGEWERPLTKANDSNLAASRRDSLRVPREKSIN